MDSDAVKECMRFGASANGRLSRGMGPIFDATVGTRAHIPWFGFTVASFERGDICQTPNGVYIYDGDGRREVPVTGGRGTGMAKMKELYDLKDISEKIEGNYDLICIIFVINICNSYLNEIPKELVFNKEDKIFFNGRYKLYEKPNIILKKDFLKTL